MPVTRMRMRPWLERMIESNSIAGLTWVDKNRTMFSIPWKHAARHGWEMDKDANLFKQWAIHTGKYSEGQMCDPKTWKANFRCAMNSLPDIEEVKDRSVNKGHQAVRVFRMLPATQKVKAKRSKAAESKQRKRSSTVKTEEDEDSDTQSSVESMHEDNASTQENTVDSTVNAEPTDLPFCPMPSTDVPDWSSTVEIGFDSFPDNFRHRFEVSPDHLPDDFDEDITNDIIQICAQLEKDTHLMSGGTSGMGFLVNEACSSPESIWSDSSEPDEPHYTTLSSDLALFDSPWSNFQRPHIPFPML